jgi:uncharacterized repeat protein (TIGR03803 family)
VLYRFTAQPPDGFFPVGNPVFDRAGNLYGTTLYSEGWGIVYELKPSNGGWAESVVYGFTGHEDGATPMSGPILDRAGNLYGTTSMGGNFVCDGGHGCGTVYELTPSGPGWTEHTLYTFHNGSDGSTPLGGLILDSSGNLYGTTSTGGSNGGGTVFELTSSNGSWTFHLLYSFTGVVDDVGPTGSLAMDSGGKLYGSTLSEGAYGDGTAFKLTPAGGGWTYTDLHDFAGGSGDGLGPYGSPTLDMNGNIYGTAAGGGTGTSCSYGCGVVWEIMP